MKFYDSSALVPLLIEEPSSALIESTLSGGADLFIWTLTPIEITSALTRLLRKGTLSEEQFQEALKHLQHLLGSVYLVEHVAEVKLRAFRCLKVHPLKSADALQLAAALTLCFDQPQGHSFITLDKQLASAASKEGFEVELEN